MQDPQLIEIRARLSALQACISHMEGALEEKRRQYDGLLAEVASKLCKSAGDLPTETISQIIETVVFSLDDPLPRLQQLTKLRLLDSRWNQIVLDNPSFWKEVTLMVGNEHQWRRAIDRTQRRIGEIPSLHVHIEMRHDDRNLLPDDIVSFLSSNAGKVTTLSIQTAVQFKKIIGQMMRQRPAIIWTSLSSMRIISSEHEQHDGIGASYDSYLIISQEHLPALHVFEVKAPGPFKRDILHLFGVPWSQLTSLTLAGFINAPSDYLLNLSKCVGVLEHLSIDVDGASSRYQSSSMGQTFTFNRLQSLVLRVSWQCDPFQGFFNKLIVPCLEYLEYTDEMRHLDSDFPDRMLDAFTSMVERSSCRLLEVKIQLNDRLSMMDKDALFRFLRSAPYLKAFDLSIPNLSGAFLVDMEDHLFCNLERFELTALRPHGGIGVLMGNFSKWAKKCAERQANSVINEERKGAVSLVSTKVDGRQRLEARLCVEELEVVRTIKI